MTSVLFLLAAVLIASIMFLMTPASTLARLLRREVPIGLMIAGAGLLLLRQPGIGLAMVAGGMALRRRLRGVQPLHGPAGGQGSGQRSSVRSAALEMELDHETGAMNGVVLVGRYEGSLLDDMEEGDLITLHREIRDDGESLALLEAYLDRRLAGWREDAETDAGAGEPGPSGTGSMGEEEAYQVLGLAPGASAASIRRAHRRLMKTAHPDSGGSTFLAAKINEAKDVLLRSHS